MKWQEICVRTEPEAVEAVAEVFFRLGSGGVVIEDPSEVRRMAQSGQWDAFELPDESLTRICPQVKGYLPFNEELAGKMEDLEAELAEIMTRLGKEPCCLSIKAVQEEDWANSWKAYFKPLRIGQRLVVRPSWEEYVAESGDLVIVLDPGMAFGTGSHGTTVMCARLLEKYLQPGEKVIDVGTGSGILAISAGLLGAGEVLAIEYDPVAVKAATENVRANSLEAKITVQRNDLLTGINMKAHLIVANIIADIIIRLLPQVSGSLLPEGIFIASGIIQDRRNDVVRAAEGLGYVLLEESVQEDWVAQVWKMREWEKCIDSTSPAKHSADRK